MLRRWLTHTFQTLILSVFLGICVVAPLRAAVDFKEVLKSVVMVQAQVPSAARTADRLGTTRQGSGVVIDDKGLILTIGYLVMEADQTSVVTALGNTIPATPVAYDHTSGFGLVRALAPLGVGPLTLGSSAAMSEKSIALIMSLGESRPVTPVQVVSRRAFAGSWEYLLERAIYTMPAHREFGGAALINDQGQLVGIGSLFVSDAMGSDALTPGNMFVPTDLLKPILADLLANGRRTQASPPWLGIYTDAQGGRVIVTRVADAGPGQRAGIKAGDIVMGVGGRRVSDMVDFYQRVRDSGTAGAAIDIDLLPHGVGSLEIKKVTVTSEDRHDWLSKPQSH
ncbi:MAG: serine protease [Rhodospirillales bacterium]|nr:serine protease [Rhodospirillales bacterium]